MPDQAANDLGRVRIELLRIERAGVASGAAVGALLVDGLRANLAIYDRGLCGDRRVLSEAAVRRTHTDRTISYGGLTGTGYEGYGFGWWVDRDDPTKLVDPGAYGAYAWLDEERGYGGFFALEEDVVAGAELFARVLPVTVAAIDAGE